MAKFVFFDSRAVKNAVDKGTRKALSRFGAFVRQRAKTSIRKRKRISRPGEPPSSHTGKLKKNIYFGYDAQRKSVVVGATQWSRSGAQSILEYGGTENRLRRNQTIRAIYRPRPYMRPAFSKELQNVNKTFTNIVR